MVDYYKACIIMFGQMLGEAIDYPFSSVSFSWIYLAKKKEMSLWEKTWIILDCVVYSFMATLEILDTWQ